MNLENNICNNSLVTNVMLSNFRNFDSINVPLSQYNVLFGNNGSGKTNFLEALSLLSTGKGLRGASFQDLLNTKNYQLRTIFTISSPLGNNSISILNESYSENNFTSTPPPVKKIFLLDNEPIKKLHIILQYIKSIWITPKMDTLFLEDNKVQRNFFDRLIFNLDSSHLTRVNAYNKALKERNTLLKINSRNQSWFTALEEILSTHAVAIAASRVDFLNKINSFICNKASGYFSNIMLQTDGLIENILLKGEMSALNCEFYFKDKLKFYRNRDFQTGSTSIGIHKSNINILNLSKNLYAKNCSTGEQKIILITIIISFIKIAMIESCSSILLLLDEILVHLDKLVRNTVLEELLNLPLQFVVTSTDIDYFSNFKKKITFLKVKNNNIFSC